LKKLAACSGPSRFDVLILSRESPLSTSLHHILVTHVSTGYTME